jgi:hypothetical protein
LILQQSLGVCYHSSGTDPLVACLESVQCQEVQS